MGFAFFFRENRMENLMLINLIWFLAGAALYKFLSYIFEVGLSINLFTQTLVGSLLMVKKVDEQMLLIFDKEADILKSSNSSEEQIKKNKEMSLYAHKLWRIMIIKTIISCCPNKLRSTLRFNDWASAMKILKK